MKNLQKIMVKLFFIMNSLVTFVLVYPAYWGYSAFVNTGLHM
jgi:hypothetical protein